MVGCPPGGSAGMSFCSGTEISTSRLAICASPKVYCRAGDISRPPSSRNLQFVRPCPWRVSHDQPESTGASNVLDPDSKRNRSVVALDREFNVLADTHALQLVRQVRQASGGLSVGADDHIAKLIGLFDPVQAGRRRRRTGQSTHHDHAFDSESCCDRLVCSDDPDAGRRHPAVPDQLRHHPIDRVDRNGESYAGVRAGRRNDGRRYADQPPRRIEQRAAGIAGVNCGVGLDHVSDFATGAGRQSPLERADHTGAQRLIEAKRIADGECGLSHLQISRGADRDRRRQSAGSTQPDDRQIVIGRGSHNGCTDDFAAGETNRDLLGSAHHVIVGHDMAGTVPNEPGAGLLAHALTFHIGGVGGQRCSDHLNHGRRYPFKKLDGRAFGFSQVAARGDRPWRCRRKQHPVDVGLTEQRGDEQYQHDGGDPEKTLVHRFTPKPQHRLARPNRRRHSGRLGSARVEQGKRLLVSSRIPLPERAAGLGVAPRNGGHVMQKQFLAKFVVVAALMFPVSSFGQGGGGGGGGSSGGGSAGGASAGGAASGGAAATSGAGTATGTATGSTATGAATGSTATGSTATGTSTGGAVNNSGTGTAAGPSNTGAPTGTINSPGTNNASTGLTQGNDQAASPAAPGTNTSGTAISTGSGRPGTTTGTARNQGAANGNRIDGTVTPGPSMPGDAEIRAEDPKVDAKIKSICRGC